MPDIETETTSMEGFATTSYIDNWEITIDATNESGPNPNEVLVANYAACFIPAFRVGAERAGHDDLGKVKIDAGADLDEGDDLETIEFEVRVEAALGEDVEDIALRAENICHVHDALREELHADITVRDDAEF